MPKPGYDHPKSFELDRFSKKKKKKKRKRKKKTEGGRVEGDQGSIWVKTYN